MQVQQILGKKTTMLGPLSQGQKTDVHCFVSPLPANRVEGGHAESLTVNARIRNAESLSLLSY